MEVINYTSNWVKGEVMQGKSMIVIGLLLIFALTLVFRGENTLLKGMIIPVSLVVIATLGFGTHQVINRPKHLEKVEKLYTENPKQVLKDELSKSLKDHKAYTTLKPIWAGLILVGILLYFFLTKDYFKGLGLGIMFLGMSLLLLDSTLHNRLEKYLQKIEQLEM